MTLEHLKNRLREVDDLQSAASLLRWDLQVYMPPGGAPARGRQTATLSRLAHERFTDAEIGRLLDACDRDDLSDDDRALVRVTRRLYEQAIRVPASLVAEWNEHAAVTYQAWTAARPANDFEAVRPLLEKTLELSRRQANCFPGYESIADPLIDTMDYGMKASTVRALFGQLRDKLVPLVRAITSRELVDDRCLKRRVPEADQLAFGFDVIRAYGYDFERGRQDKTVHPFMTKFSLGDVRITTRVNENDLTDALFGTLHECGHACTSRTSAASSRARRSRTGPRTASTRASRGCGRTSSGEAGRSGSTSIQSSSRRCRSSPMCRSTRSTARSTRSSDR
jgi:carboxypeptidase Taq